MKEYRSHDLLLSDASEKRAVRTLLRSVAQRSILLAACVVTVGCQQKMADQPYYRPYRASTFFADHRSARPLEPGTIARGTLRHDVSFETGRAAQHNDAQAAATLVGAGNPLAAAATEAAMKEPAFVKQFPLPVDAALLRRGQERFTIYCAVCHDPAGTGNGIVVQRGFSQPPPYYPVGKRQDLSRGYLFRGTSLPLREVPVGYIFNVISNGFGAMPDYAAQIPPRDRWAIVAYVRALQLSRYAPLDELPAEQQQKVRATGEAKP